MEEDFKGWTAQRKSALVLEIIQGKTTLAVEERNSVQSTCATPNHAVDIGRTSPAASRSAGISARQATMPGKTRLFVAPEQRPDSGVDIIGADQQFTGEHTVFGSKRHARTVCFPSICHF